MRSPNELKPKSISVNLTPMIDVVFLLIIFFIVSNKMMKDEASIELDLPSAATGQDRDDRPTGKMIINVLSKDEILFGTRPVSLEELRLALLSEKKASKVPLEVRIRTDRTVLFQEIEPILVLCARCGIGNVSFSVLEQQSEHY